MQQSEEQSFLRAIYRGDRPGRNAYIATYGESPYRIARHGDYSSGTLALERAKEQILADYELQQECHERLGDDAVPYAKMITGTQLMAHAFGAEVEQLPDQMPFARPIVADAEGAKSIRAPRVEDARPLMRVRELADSLTATLGPEVPLGPPDMQTGFDTACLLWAKDDLLVSLYDEDAAAVVEWLAGECAALLAEFLAALRDQFPQMSPCHCPTVWAPPEMGPWVSNDESGTIGREHYDRFCHPELVSLSERFGGIGTHCCADAEHQFSRFQETPDWYAFNRVAGQKGYGSLCEHFPAEAPAPALVFGWVGEEDQRMLEDHFGRDGRLIFHRSFPTYDEAARWLEWSRTS
ncbi:MAG: hypothetical protein ACOCZB_04895 [Spirochaetota bacterium]